MSTPTFPQEIVDIIIDCVWDLQREVKPWRVNAGAHRVDGQEPFNVFALVSRSWVARARHCAFRDLTFRRKWSTDARQFTGAVLEHTLCTIREHVQHLDFDTDTDTSRTVRCQTAHFSYITNFPNLRSLGLYDLVFEAHLWDSSILESMLLPALENLEVKSCTFPREACLVELLACATGLRSLRCWYISVHATEPIPSVYSGPQHLTELSITVTHHACRQFLEWMLSASVPPRIANLELQGIDSESVASVSRVLQVLGSSVVTLSLLMRSLERIQNNPRVEGVVLKEREGEGVSGQPYPM
ncbi:hypothetical protein EXIGLDRAFT_778975 [Exidia glandulosa HHB12029]|uniref:F-box domain-containing protein n=1 Tax=Exidia glandulosa HHB12029 TaxID=1314781 RepID=A0A165CAL8_EXIGL|nr:hypothetical protein EXIGLDRAFT_778975 [Exidia glandulosa HHB12029]